MEARKRLKNARKQMGLTQEDFGKPIGLSRHGITSLESGKVKISTLHALVFEYVHKISAKWLLTGEGEMIVQSAEPANLVSNSDVIHYQSPIEAEHMELIKQFRNKERAKIINEHLVELEGIDESLFNNVEAYLNGVVSSAKVLKGSKQSGRSGGNKRKVNER